MRFDAFIAGVRRLPEREGVLGELGSGLGALLCGIFSWTTGAPLEHHPVFGTLASLIGGHVVEAIWMACGVGQMVAVLADRWPWRWLAAMMMTAGWTVPVLQAFKNSAEAPIVAGACAAWVFVNAAAARRMVRQGCRGTR